MTQVEKTTYKLLLLGDGLAIFISMVAGPLGYSGVAISAGVSAAIISISLICYGLYFWKK